MIWAAIWSGDRSNIEFMRRDEDAPRRGYTSASYIEVLEQQIPRIYQPDMIWQQDNASIHTAQRVTQWLTDHGIVTIEWPSNSPDLNPIEHCWSILKDYLNQHYPQLVYQGQDERDIREFYEAIEQSWLAIRQEVIDSCVQSMRRRVAAVIKAKGWYTKY